MRMDAGHGRVERVRRGAEAELHAARCVFCMCAWRTECRLNDMARAAWYARITGLAMRRVGSQLDIGTYTFAVCSVVFMDNMC